MRAQEKAAIDNLNEVKEVFDKLGIRCWLDWGTLLGAVRDGKLIEWEHDVDLGTMEDWEKIASAVPKLERRGFTVFMEEIKIDENLFDRRVHLQKSGSLVDVIPYQVKGNQALWMLSESSSRYSQILKVLYHALQSQKMHIGSPRWKFVVGSSRRGLLVLPPGLKKRLSGVVWRAWKVSDTKVLQIAIPKHYFEKLRTINFYGKTFKIPADAEGYLEYHYGKNWRTPKKEWDWQKEDGTVKEVITK